MARVAEAHLGKFYISTVFLGIDHNFLGKGGPILFETMVFAKGGRVFVVKEGSINGESL